jgi:enamine deaminase RidA (YjgF/YER057c/UK114 family)
MSSEESVAPLGAIEPEGWARPSGYANGIAARGRVVAIAGQVGWNPATCAFETDDFAAQVRQALANIQAVLRAAGGGAHDLVRLTWYVTDKAEYLAARREIGHAYRELFGAYYPAMTLVQVAALLEERARVEIEATAVIGK